MLETALDINASPEKMKTTYETKLIFVYTEGFAPPEYESNNTVIPQKYDPYSFGVTFYIMLMKAKDSKSFPMEKYKILELLEGHQCKPLIEWCLENVDKRCTFADIKKEFSSIFPKYTEKEISLDKRKVDICFQLSESKVDALFIKLYCNDYDKEVYKKLMEDIDSIKSIDGLDNCYYKLGRIFFRNGLLYYELFKSDHKSENHDKAIKFINETKGDEEIYVSYMNKANEYFPEIGQCDYSIVELMKE